MSSYIQSWNTLETIGPKGKGFYPNTDHAKNAGRNIMRYAGFAPLVKKRGDFRSRHKSLGAIKLARQGICQQVS